MVHKHEGKKITKKGRGIHLIDQIPKPNVEHIKILKIEDVITPHPYCITPKHLETGRMYLDKEAIKEAEEKYGAVCDICRQQQKHGIIDKILSIDEHKEQKILFLEVPKTDDLNKVSGLKEYLMKIKPILQKLKIDGIAFKQV